MPIFLMDPTNLSLLCTIAYLAALLHLQPSAYQGNLLSLTLMATARLSGGFLCP